MGLDRAGKARRQAGRPTSQAPLKRVLLLLLLQAAGAGDAAVLIRLLAALLLPSLLPIIPLHAAKLDPSLTWASASSRPWLAALFPGSILVSPPIPLSEAAAVAAADAASRPALPPRGNSSGCRSAPEPSRGTTILGPAVAAAALAAAAAALLRPTTTAVLPYA